MQINEDHMITKKPLADFFISRGRFQPEKALEVINYFEELELDKNQLFLQEGKVSNHYLILEQGMMRSFTTDWEGKEITTAFWKGLQPVFEVASFFMRIPSMENIQAVTPCKGWVISFEDLNLLFHSLPEFRELGRGLLVQSFATYKIRTLSMLTQSAEQRYASLMQQDPEIFQHVPLKHIASYLGITDSSLSRIRKEIHKK